MTDTIIKTSEYLHGYVEGVGDGYYMALMAMVYGHSLASGYGHTEAIRKDIIEKSERGILTKLPKKEGAKK